MADAEGAAMTRAEATVAEIKGFLNGFKASVDQQFADLRTEVTELKASVDRLEKKVDDLADVVQGMATGHAARFNAIEDRLGRVRVP